VAWLGVVACQIGTAFAVRTDHASLRSIGVFSNRYLVGGIAFSLAFAAVLVYAPVMDGFFGTAALSPAQLLAVAPYPLIVWGTDELRRMLARRHSCARDQGKLPFSQANRESRLDQPGAELPRDEVRGALACGRFQGHTHEAVLSRCA
jgi:Cation transporting ATPase, C-terminus